VELIADLAASSAAWTKAGDVLLSQLLPTGTTVFFPTSEPVNPLSLTDRVPSVLTIWLNFSAMVSSKPTCLATVFR
jgi:hypothetical protein